jgi:hypothetical protein
MISLLPLSYTYRDSLCTSYIVPFEDLFDVSQPFQAAPILAQTGDRRIAVS